MIMHKARSIIILCLAASCASESDHDHRNLRGPISNFIDTLFGRNLNCPPAKFSALKKFDLDSYISASWFPVKQIPLSYQPREEFYCVRATYIKDTGGCIFCGNAPRIDIYNQARNGSVTGPMQGDPYNASQPGGNGLFRGFQKQRDMNPAELTVGFFSQYDPSRNYWIVAAGTYAEALNGTAIPSCTTYEWAIITAGSPDLETENGLCIPKPGIVPFYGMWMFMRDGVPPPGVIESVDAIALKMGLDTSKWFPVEQAGFVSCCASESDHDHRNLRGPFSNFIDTIFGRNLNCPPANFSALKEFDLESYISASWFPVKQTPLVYQPPNDFYCVRATYIIDTGRCLFCGNTPKVKIYNEAKSGSVTGLIVGSPYNASHSSSDYTFRGFQKYATKNPAKITVGFFSQFALKSNYWIVAAGTYAEALSRTAKPSTTTYDWAIVTDGSPDLETEDGLCIPKPGIIPFYGMWMLMRDGVPPAGVIDSVDSIANDIGLDNTRWLPVTQEGCVY